MEYQDRLNLQPSTPTDLAQLAVSTAGDRRLVVLVDGDTGAGKTTLAGELVPELARVLGVAVQLVSLDAVYPGWNGLASGSDAVAATILASYRPGYRRFDWQSYQLADWVDLDPEAPIVVEGCGAITAASARLATFKIWVERDPAARQLAVHRREGDANWWQLWAEQEERHKMVHAPMMRSDVIVVAN